MAHTGRPSILTPQLKDAIVDLLKRGNYISTSARAVGINPNTIGVWVKKGMELATSDKELDETEQLYVEFAVEVEKARAFAEVQHVETIRKASQENWTAAAWWLERTNPRDWGKVQRTEVTGADGGAIQVDIEAVNRKIEALLANQQAIEAVALSELPAENETTQPPSSEISLSQEIQAEMARRDGSSEN